MLHPWSAVSAGRCYSPADSALVQKFDNSVREENMNERQADYRAMTGISNSMLSDFIEHPQKYEGLYVTETIQRTATTVAQQFGLDFENMCWACIDEDITIIPEEVLNKQGHRKGNAWAQWELEHKDSGKILMTARESEKHGMGIKKGIANIKSHANANALIFGPADPWPIVQWLCPASGLARKAELDVIESSMIVDLKTAKDVSPSGWAKAAHNWGYHRQAATYQQAVKTAHGDRLPVVFVCVKNSEPYDCAVYEMDQAWIDVGLAEVNVAMLRLAVAKEENRYLLQTHDTIVTLKAPRYIKYEKEYE